MRGSVVIRSENGMGGVLAFPTTEVNTLETSATTSRSVNPVIIAIGKSVNNDLLLFKESLL